jgi:hypothetical protein
VKIEVIDLTDDFREKINRELREDFWAGVIVGHWFVGPSKVVPARRLKKVDGTRRRVHVCFSRCGVIEFYEPWEIATGRIPDTCYGCRPGQKGAPPSNRVLAPKDLEKILYHWESTYMATAFEERSNLVGRPANDAWADYGRPLLGDVCSAAGFPRTFGWKAFVRDCSNRPGKMSDRDHTIRVRAVHVAEKRIEIVLQPAKSRFVFTVDLATGRTDVPFTKIADAISAAVKRYHTGEPEPIEPAKVAAAATPEPAKPAEPPSNGHPAGVAILDVKELSGLYERLGKVLAVSKDVNELAQEKMLVRQKVEAADREMNKAVEEEAQANRERHDFDARARAHAERIAEMERKLATERQLWNDCRKEAHEADMRAAVAVGEHATAEGRLKEAKAKMAELEAFEKEILASQGDAAQMARLIQALAGAKV